MTDLKEGFPVHGVEDDSGEDQGEESAQHQSHPRGGGLQQGQQACNFKSRIYIRYRYYIGIQIRLYLLMDYWSNGACFQCVSQVQANYLTLKIAFFPIDVDPQISISDPDPRIRNPKLRILVK